MPFVPRVLGGSLKRSLGMACPKNGDLSVIRGQPSPRPSALRLPPGERGLLTHSLRNE